MHRKTIAAAAASLLLSGVGLTAGSQSIDPLAPALDHHQHLLSPALAKQWSDRMLPVAAVPEEITALPTRSRPKTCRRHPTSTRGENDWTARQVAQFPDRVLFGSDGSFGRRPTPRQQWGTFQGLVPLSEAEIAAIASNVAPYAR